MANISEQCVCEGELLPFGGQGEKKSLSKFTDCSFMVLASCLESQDEIYP